MSDIRTLLKQARETRRITHPYAKYTVQGTLYCTACTLKIASEVLWEKHVSSTPHKEKVQDVVRESQRKAKRGIEAAAGEEGGEWGVSKRVKLEKGGDDKVGEERLPSDFFDGGMRPTTTTTTEGEGEEKPDGTSVEGLPSDFFDVGMRPATQGVDENEWKKFQAEIAETIRTQEEDEGDDDDVEELQRAIVREFDEMTTLEDRVAQLKKRRAELQRTTSQLVQGPPVQEVEEDDAAEFEEGWW